MNPFSELNINKEQVIKLCQKHGIKLMVLHGSHARQQAGKNSDIDIGILCDRKVDLERYRNILNDFEDIFGDKFDPVFLNGVESMISYNVALAGIPLYEANNGDFAEFKVQSIGRYLDTKKFRDLEKMYVQGLKQ